jgi:dihydroorotate dehydrogenase (NAD+) catalytic subunit
MSSLAVEFLGVKFENPLILPSGILQEIKDHKQAEKMGLGGVTTKPLSVEPREGNPMPRVIKYKYGILNSVGLRNPGLEKGLPSLKEFIDETKIPVIASAVAVSIDDFRQLVEALVEIEPEFIELNLSCPNTDDWGKPFALEAKATEAVVKVAKKAAGGRAKIIAKLSPNVPNISEIAKAAERAGADAISAINTVGPGMVINIRTRKPMLGNKEGGVSGPGILPVAVRCIYKSVDVPIIGMGGVESGEDVIEIMMAGS